MKRGVSLIALVIAAVAAVAPLLGTPIARACSPGADFDAVESSNIIVEGTVTGWEVAPMQLPGPETFTPVLVHVAVSRVWKGASMPA